MDELFGSIRASQVLYIPSYSFRFRISLASQPHSITSFSQLACLFEKHFLGAKPMRKSPGHLMLIRRCEDEPLDKYAKRFNDKAMQVEDFLDQATVQVMMGSLQPSSFKWDIAKYQPKKVSTMIEEPYKHVIAKRCIQHKVDPRLAIGYLPPNKTEASFGTRTGRARLTSLNSSVGYQGVADEHPSLRNSNRGRALAPIRGYLVARHAAYQVYDFDMRRTFELRSTYLPQFDKMNLPALLLPSPPSFLTFALKDSLTASAARSQVFQPKILRQAGYSSAHKMFQPFQDS
ncbi:hypothetical protein FNV43_RR21582 [Rhamnella rubrinervis]|uniref:Retrotransposon gag domain-containing protein n=1 Tax=Rhamnella rubrinervis TaxID=2594499 RepID=A0A8K0E0A2_9ROSA|nr:hypothetical protein FNV43_RR21582 [Rhamnella rubrinervis]